MNPSDYRREYAAYCSASEHERYKLHAGLSTEPRFAEIEDRFADLWTPGATEDLRRARDETPPHFQTERAALCALAGAAALGYLKARTHEVGGELAGCNASARIDWNGERIAATAPDFIAAENDGARRRDLAARWFDALRPCNDLRAARLESLADEARVLGFDSLPALEENHTGANLEKLASTAETFLERTAPVYMSRLAQWAARRTPPLITGALCRADAIFFERAAHLDGYFRAGDFRAVYDETTAALGIGVQAQPNILIDGEARSSKQARTACFAVKPPEDVRFVLGSATGGMGWFRTSLREAGRAQHLAWASRDLSVRYPEFVYPPDCATGEAYGLLLSGLLHEAVWLEGRRGWRATEAQEVARFVALAEMYEVRRACAGLRHWLTLSTADDLRSEGLIETYAALYGEATGFRHEAATHMLDAESAAGAAAFLRARLFASGLREHLRERFGARWYAARGAGDELIDLWNTASRYPVEELARLVWGGELDFDLLADELVTAVNV
ncbi:MAG TPA: hypothetical protein VM934_15755 [Pyrinomonadaceae bacterium]|nr:hypothetical protein [Pyrinomonadaceae bacterium]